MQNNNDTWLNKLKKILTGDKKAPKYRVKNNKILQVPYCESQTCRMH